MNRSGVTFCRLSRSRRSWHYSPRQTKRAQVGTSPVKVDTKGLVAKIKFEAPLEGFLKEINGKYKLRVTELTLAPGGHVGEHNHEGPGIRQVTSRPHDLRLAG